jgi:hypothetical protein
VIHKGLQRDIVGEDSLRGLRNTTVRASGVCGRWVELGEEETGLGAAGITDNESGKRETVLDQALGVFLWSLQQFSKVSILLVLLVSFLSPRGNGLAVEDEDVEECIEEENSVGLDRLRVKQNSFGFLPVNLVLIECWLNHDQAVADIFVIQHVPVECRFVGRVVENLKELASTEMEHELRVQCEIAFQSVIMLVCRSTRSCYIDSPER